MNFPFFYKAYCGFTSKEVKTGIDYLDGDFTLLHSF